MATVKGLCVISIGESRDRTGVSEELDEVIGEIGGGRGQPTRARVY
jgi:hypothetical protein